MKKIVALILILTIAVLQQIAAKTSIDGAEFIYKGVRYTILDGATGTCQVSSQRGGCSEEVIIFDEAEDSFFREKFQVVDVAGYAFKDCNNLKTLIVAGHIDKYGEYLAIHSQDVPS